MREKINEFYNKFKLNGTFDLKTTKTDFISHFKDNVENQEIAFFSGPNQTKTLNKYYGNITGNHFTLKKSPNMDNSNFHLEVCKGNITEKNSSVNITYEINGFQGFPMIITIIYFISLLFIFYDGFNFPSILFFTFSTFIVYKIVIKENLKAIREFEKNFEIDVRNWFRV